MTHLARKIACMFLVHLDIILTNGDRDVTRLATGRLHPVITMIGWRDLLRLWPSVAVGTIFWRTMHFMAGMAINTRHTPLAKMNIRPQIFMLAEVFIAHTTAVAGGAVARHRRCFVKQMSFDEAAPNQIGLAYMALTTSSMAGAAMIAKHAFNGFMIFW